METDARPYPAHWEADVVLRDGGTAHLRPIRPDDAERLERFHSRLSEQTIYFRFFAPYPRLTPRDVTRFTVVDHVDRVAIIALVGAEMIGVVRYDRIPGPDGKPGTEAEVAFNIEDAHQGRGLGAVLLEHVAAAAHERGIEGFVAEVLPTNRKMIAVFKDAGYKPSHDYEDGVLHMEFAIEQTAESLAVMQAREHRAEAESMLRLLRPTSVAVVGAGRARDSLGNLLLRDILTAGFTGTVYAVNPRASEVEGVPCYPSLAEVPGPVDLAVVAVPASAMAEVVADAASQGVHGLVVASAGFAETGDEEGLERQRTLVRTARRGGMRVVGPSSLGIINTDPEIRLGASLAPGLPRRGRVGFFSQSGALGIAVLEALQRRGLGLSTFVSAGNRADVSGNDLLQYWEEDDATEVVLLYLETIGNPRKFSRLCRRIGRTKPVVAVGSGRSLRALPPGIAVRESRVPAAAVNAVFDQAGIVRVDTLHEMLDVASVLAFQPLPGGRRVAIVGNSAALCALAENACADEHVTVVGYPVVIDNEASVDDFERALTAVFAEPDVDSVVAVFVPPLVTPDEAVRELVTDTARGSQKTCVASFISMGGVRRLSEDAPAPDRGLVPAFPTPEDAVRALAAVTEYAQWRRRPAGTVPDLLDIDRSGARARVEHLLAENPEGRDLTAAEAADLLAHYGIIVWARHVVGSALEAVEAAQRVGFPVALKATAPHLRHRVDLGSVQLGLVDARAVRTAFAEMAELFGRAVSRSLVVQRMAPPGVSVIVASEEDPRFGPIVSFGVAGVATELLEDRSFRIPPLTDSDAAAMVREVRASPLLFGHRGAAPVAHAAVEELLLRVATLCDELPEVACLELNSVLVSASGLAVLDVDLRLAPPAVRSDLGPRRL